MDRLLSNAGIDVWDRFARWAPQQAGTQTDILVAMDRTDFDDDGQSTLVLSLVADSDDAARVFRTYSAHRSNLMPLTILI